MRGVLKSKNVFLLSGCMLAMWSGAAAAQSAPADSPTPGAGAAAQQQSTGAVQSTPASSQVGPLSSDAPNSTEGVRPSDTVAPGDIVVTAQRRSERLVDVPASISVVSGQDVAKAGVVNIHDLGNAVSGVQINFAGCCTQPAVRGVSTLTTGIGFENNVATYVDGFYTPDNATINSDLANISSVEVLKGPQGTLYGRNATGGAILINTLAPSKTLTGKFSGTYGRFNEFSLNGYVSGPITNDIRFGVAAYWRKSDGYNRLIGPDGSVASDRITPEEQISIRNKIEADITSNLKATVSYNYGKSDDPRGNVFKYVGHLSPALPATIANPNAPFDLTTNRGGALNATTSEATAKIALETGIGTITSYSGYAHRHTLLAFDFDGSYADLSYGLQNWSQNTVQQTVDLNVNKINHVDLVIGAMYYNDYLHTDPYQLNFANYAQSNQFSTKLFAESIAAYADGTLHLTDLLSISAGGRYTRETKTTLFNQYSATGIFLFNGAGQTTYARFTPHASIRYEVAPRTNVYFSYSKGFRSGGYQPTGAVSQAAFRPFLPEDISSYEVGFKTSSRLLQFNIAGFYYDYTNMQVGTVAPNPNGSGAVISIVSNAKASQIYGIDGDMTITPVERLNVRLGGAWLHARYTDFTNAVGTGLNATTGLNVSNQVQDWNGQQMIRSPNFSGNLGADYTVSAIAGGSVQFGANAHYTASFITNNGSLFGPLAGSLANQQRYRQGAYTLLNLQATWSDPSNQLHFGVFGNNVTNKIYRLTYSGGAFGDYASAAAPATYGFRVGLDF